MYRESAVIVEGQPIAWPPRASRECSMGSHDRVASYPNRRSVLFFGASTVVVEILLNRSYPNP